MALRTIAFCCLWPFFMLYPLRLEQHGDRTSSVQLRPALQKKERRPSLDFLKAPAQTPLYSLNAAKSKADTSLDAAFGRESEETKINIKIL